MLSISTNPFFAFNVSRQSRSAEGSLARLSSGQRIIRSEDDPAGLSIAEGMKALKEGSQQAQRNILDAINLVRIGQDGVQGLFPIIDRIRELVLQASNGTYTTEDRQAIQDEIDNIKNLFGEAFYVAHAARIDLDGKDYADRILHFQVGPNANEMISVDYNPLRNILYNFILDIYGYQELHESKFGEMLVAAFGSPAPKPSDPVPPVGPWAGFPPGTTFADAFPKKLVVNSGIDEDLNTSLNLIDKAKRDLVGQAAYLGAVTNRLEATLENVQQFEVNITASESQIRDADMAREHTRYTKAQVQEQSAIAMLSQANSRPFRILELLRTPQ